MSNTKILLYFDENNNLSYTTKFFILVLIQIFYGMNSDLTFIYDGECPFCNNFAELLEIRSKIKNIKIVDGRKNLKLISTLLKKGYDIDKGAILLKDGEIYHGSEAINTICKQIKNPSSSLLKIISITFNSKNRTKLFYPFLLRARRFALIAKNVSTSLV